ncbi:hypothetical protein MUB18_14460 [Sphingobacterium sp. PCS056]|uniref:GapS4b family protein n=1 Tax=Sphingobacterium sp. PCS056 TaxID=2931400 RepID=UPI00200D1F30|nr:hypothetical protein [Sphingobacterium sp. PCS056]UPZ35309.1 hypothetical protein MUB18_14460 [Sphingobacterium sp. PCS056]
MSDFSYLPQGDLIRQLLVKTNISDFKIHSLLRDKGVFLPNQEKNGSVPLLMKTIISPNDFHYFLETQKNKEDKTKYRTASIQCESVFSLTEIIEKGFDINKLIDDSSPYKQYFTVKGNPTFYLEDNNTAILDYELERENLLFDFQNKTSTHSGRVIIKKNKDSELQLTLQQNITAKETHNVNELIIKNIKQRLTEKSIVKSGTDFVRIRFCDFDNKKRVQFLNSFAITKIAYLTFASTSDVDLYLDEKVESHKDIQRFLNDIDNLKLNGKSLQNHILLNNAAYFPKLILSMVKLKYNLNYQGLTGKCDVVFSFPDYIGKSRDITSELQITLDIQLDKESKSFLNQQKINKVIFDIIEKIKITKFNQFKLTGEID